jgi:hypothetical protein
LRIKRDPTPRTMSAFDLCTKLEDFVQSWRHVNDKIVGEAVIRRVAPCNTASNAVRGS